jgi:cytochrome P450
VELTSSELATFPQARTCPYLPPAGYQELRGQNWLTRVALWDKRVVWLVTGYAQARQLLGDLRLSSDRSNPDYPVLLPHMAAEVARRQLLLMGMDPPEHDVHRRMLNPYFSLKQVRALRSNVERVVTDAVEAMLTMEPPVDLVSQFALPVPSTVISELLGIPRTDQEFFQEATRRMLQARDHTETQLAGMELLRYLDRIVSEQEKAPGAGLIGQLVAHVEAGELTHQELVQLSLVLLVAGHETTASMIALGVLTLLEHPDQLARLHANQQLVPTAVEELLRVIAVTDLAGIRVATADIELDGQVIAKGDGVLISATLANRDTAVHDEPEAFDVGRPTGRQHLTFGYGIHQCIGQNLARLELEVAFRVLFDRIPTLRLAVPADQLRMREKVNVQGVMELPIAW